MNQTPTIIVGISLLFQLCVAVYAMRMTRLFGTARVGWSLFSAFLILALLHSFQAMGELHSSSFFEIRIEVVYALASLLLLIGLTHVSTDIKRRLWVESEEHRLVATLETEVTKKTEHLTLAIKELQSEIDERKRVEGQVRDQARLLDLSHDAIIVQDLEYRIQFWNKGAESIFGWKAAEAVGRKYSDLLSIDILACKSASEVALSKGLWKGEFSTRTKDEKEALVEGTWTMVYDHKGQPKSIMVVGADVTDQRALEARTLRAQRLESIGTLAGGIAHDLNNVLTPVLISVQLLKEKVATDDEKELLEALNKNVLRGAQLVKQILTFGRGVKGERAVVEPEKVLREINQFILETFPKSLSLKVNVQKDLWPVLGDATQIHQVLLNLCVNARDAMPDGGRLSVHLENVTLDEAYASRNSEARPGPYVLMKVVDTGTGIPKAIQSKIFEPFFTTKPLGKGTGLGLSTCFSIVKNHGGFINCYSEPGNGTAFNVYLPACLCTVATDCTAAEPVCLSRGRGELVLVVDDENIIREFTQIALESYGYRTLVAGDGKEALDLFKKHRDEVAVVLMDMSMPVMDGPAAVDALRAINQQVPIIGTSGLACVNEERTARHLSHFLAKPYTADLLFQSLHNALHAPSSGTVKAFVESQDMETDGTTCFAVA
jgi:two-component system cell cycle sensor histidine kinase/response regulator CckA